MLIDLDLGAKVHLDRRIGEGGYAKFLNSLTLLSFVATVAQH